MNGTDLIVQPITGEAIELADWRADRLAGELEDVDDLRYRVNAYRDAIVAELARRADARGARKVRVDGVEYEVNAPTEEAYDPGRLMAALAPLVADGTIDQELVDALVVTPPPKRPAPRVDRRRVNTLKRSTNRRLLAALAAARVVAPARRTVKIIGRVTDATALEDAPR